MLEHPITSEDHGLRVGMAVHAAMRAGLVVESIRDERGNPSARFHRVDPGPAPR